MEYKIIVEMKSQWWSQYREWLHVPVLYEHPLTAKLMDFWKWTKTFAYMCSLPTVSDNFESQSQHMYLINKLWLTFTLIGKINIAIFKITYVIYCDLTSFMTVV